MATQKEIEETYDYMDEVFRLSLGDHADITNAMYNGDFSMTLDEAQKAKHEYILKGINFKKGDRVLDIGCGWGPMVKVIKEHGGRGIGLTLSPAQARACRADGLNVRIQDWKDIDPEKFGKVDAIVSVGAFEHFCSIEEYKSGKQDEIYGQFFKLCSDILEPGGRLFLQTMMFGEKKPDPDKVSVNAPKLSDEWVWGHLAKYYPGSWLPNGLEHIIKCASLYFKLVSENNGRLDYIHTMKEWGRAATKITPKKIYLGLKLVPKCLTDKEFRYKITSNRYGCNRLAFERGIMSHQRMVFEKIK